MRSLILTVLVFGTVCACNPNLTRKSPELQQPVGVADRGYDIAPIGNTNQASNTVLHNEENPSNLTLADMIRKTSGVSVLGNDANARVRVSGISSFNGSDPLFVIDGNAVGNDFRQVYSLVNPNDVLAITVLRGNDAAIYGSRGGFGVVVIRTR